MAKAFISYCHADDSLLDKLHKHLAQLRREGSIVTWFDREISAGDRLDREISKQLEESDIFLACASPDWIASNYAYEREFERAAERQEAGKLRIVPIVFRPCDWLSTPLSDFKAIPKDGKAITEFTNQDVALLEVAQEIRRVCGELTMSFEVKDNTSLQSDQTSGIAASKYRAKRQYDEIDKRDFVEKSFEDIQRFFEASAAEIAELEGIECRLQNSDKRLSCTLINRGYGRAYETVHVTKGGAFGAIDLQYGEQYQEGVSNGGYTVGSDEYQMYWEGGAFSNFYGKVREKMSAKDVAQHIWDALLERVGISYASES